MAREIAQAAHEKKAEHVLILDLTKLDTVTDYFVICSGDVQPQVRAIAQNIEKKTRERLGEKVYHSEGMDSLNWVLLDYVDVVVHVFRPAFREFYRLEDLWSDADVIYVEDDAKPIAKKKAVRKTPAVKKAGAKKAAKAAVKKSPAKKAAVKKSPAVKKAPAKKAAKKATPKTRAKKAKA